MSKATFDLFGPASKADIKVGYISTDRGYVEGVSVCEANNYAVKNPGTTFIFKPKRDKVKFLNINEVNKLTPDSVEQETCPASPDSSGSIQMTSKTDTPPKVVFMGGGGVGVTANPIIGDDGSVLAVHVVNKGLGYQYPPIVEVKDDLGIGAGAVTRAIMGEIEEQMIYYSDKDDYEVYDLCPDIFTNGPSDGGSGSLDQKTRSEYGRRWGVDGKDLGKWIPSAYTGSKTSQFNLVVDEYIKKLQSSGKDWWTTRSQPPLKVTSTGQSSRNFYKVKHKSWGPFMDTYAISPVPPSNVKGSDHSGRWYTFEWKVDFPYDGEYIFRTARDNKSRVYIDNVPFTDKLQTFTGTKLISGKVGSTKGHGSKVTVKKGVKVLRLDLWNEPEFEEITVQQPPPPSTSDITFKITTGSMFGNGVKIEDLDINEVKPFTPPEMKKKGQLNVSHTRKIEYGKKYKVVFTSKGKSGVQGDIKYNGLHPANKNIRVVKGGKRIELLDGHGDDTNFALDIDSGKGKFSDDGSQLQGSGNIKITASWNDNPNTASVAVDSVEIVGKTWWRKGKKGSQTRTVNFGASPQPLSLKLRTIEPNIIQMEDYHDNDWTDIIINASGGQFTDLKGNIAYFSVPHPTATGSGSDSSKVKEVFNTVDYIKKANRELWRTNVYNRGGFLNDYGVCPFDTKVQLKANPYAGNHKIVWPNVNFPIDGNYIIQVAVDDNVELSIGDQVKITKNGFIGDTNVSTGTLNETKYIKKGNHTITANLYQKPGGSYSFKKPDGKVVQMSDVSFKVTTAASYANKISIPGLFSVGKEYKGAQLDQSISKKVESEKDYDVILTSAQSSNVRVRIKDNGKRLEVEDTQKGSDWNDLVCTVSKGKFYNAQGGRCKYRIDSTVKGINPMALAINIETEFSKKVVKSKKSWNENPMGVALTIESPLPPIPQEPVPKSEGRCPNNPFWTTRFPGATQRWYPVRFDGWGELLNKHAISPLPPFSSQGVAANDEGSFTNTWTKDFPYGGYYKVKMEVDDIGELWIDDEKVIDLDRRKKKTFDEKLVYISGPRTPDEDPETHKIKVVVENFKSERKKTINQKVFNTLDWLSGSAAKSEKKNIKFKITSGSMFANTIKIPELGIHESKEFTPANIDGVHQGQKGQINVTREREVEVNKIYDVEFFSSGKVGQKAKTRAIKYNNLHPSNTTIRVTRGGRRIELKDGDGNDTNFSLDIDRGNVQFAEDGKSIVINGEEARITASWNDNPNTAGVAVDSVKIGGQVWKRKGRRGSQTHTVQFGKAPTGSNIANIKLRNKGQSVVQMEDHTDNDWTDIQCAASEGRFFDFNGNKCKYVVGSATKVSGGVSGSTTKEGVTYKGPHLFHYQDKRWGKVMNMESVSPIGSPSQKLSEPNENILGNKVLEWQNVDFPITGKYDISFVADNNAKLFIDDKEYLKAPDNYATNQYNSTAVEVNKGKHNVRVELFNSNHQYKKSATDNDKIFLSNPTGVALRIYVNRLVGSGTYKPWTENPIGVSAKLIPPPCPKKVKGKGIIPEVIVDDPGNGFPRGDGSGYPVALKIKKIRVKDPGINYKCCPPDKPNCNDGDKIKLEPSMGSELQLVCGPFGRISEVKIINPGLGFTRTPQVIIDTDTGVNLDIGIDFDVVVDPIIPPEKLIQVTDLAGLKQTGYYRGRPYYGAVFYQDGIRYAGWYETAGELVQIYDTMQESIDAQVTTPASAILRQGSDITSNDPRLNIPGTPENLI